MSRTIIEKNLAELVEWNREAPDDHHIICTGTTGELIEEIFERKLNKSKSKTGNYLQEL